MDNHLSFEDILDQYGELTYTNIGVSMMPMLREKRDVFTVRKKEGRCQVNDVALFRRGNRYVLHRVIEVTDEGYTMLGDNCVLPEKDVKEEDVLGVMVSFQRDGKLIQATDPKYLRYVSWIRRTENMRHDMKKTAGKLKRLLTGKQPAQ